MLKPRLKRGRRTRQSFTFANFFMPKCWHLFTRNGGKCILCTRLFVFCHGGIVCPIQQYVDSLIYNFTADCE